MNLKYYLRGIGIGIFVAAAIFILGKRGDNSMTDAQVVARARELGMVEDSQRLLAEQEAEVSPMAGTEDIGGKKNAVTGEEETGTVTPTAKAGETEPTLSPSAGVTAEAKPTVAPTARPTAETKPTVAPTARPTAETKPTVAPTARPTAETKPTAAPTARPTAETKPTAAPGQETQEVYVVINVYNGDGSGTIARRIQEQGLVKDAKAFDDYLCRNGYDRRISTGSHEIPMGATEEEIARIICGRKK